MFAGEGVTYWCSFCTSRPTDGGTIEMPELDVSLPVCEVCMEDPAENVFPLIVDILNDNQPRGFRNWLRRRLPFLKTESK